MGYTVPRHCRTCRRLRFIPTRVGYTRHGAGKARYYHGSSPLAWGIHPLTFPIYTDIPVHPHSRGVYWFFALLIQAYMTVHPHSRGVYSLQYTGCCRTTGSSPLAWGIPLICVRVPGVYSVHPHSRGVYVLRYAMIRVCSGSSPLAWGIRTTPRIPHKIYGSSPLAWGILGIVTPLAAVSVGSSPLAWGILTIGPF